MGLVSFQRCDRVLEQLINDPDERVRWENIAFLTYME